MDSMLSTLLSWENISRDTDMVEEIFERTACVGECDAEVGRDVEFRYKFGKIVMTDEIITPYFHRKMDSRKIYEGDDRGMYQNYTAYDLFVLRTKITPAIRSINPEWYPEFIPLESDGKMFICIRLYDGIDFVPTTGSLYNKIKNIVDDSISYYPDYALLISDEHPIYYNGNCYPSNWLSSIMTTNPVQKFMTNPDYPDIKILVDGFNQNGAIYVSLDSESSYKQTYDDMYINTLNIIDTLFKIGSIVLDPRIDSRFITKWKLSPNNLLSPAGENEERLLYHPTWKNIWITTSPTDLLIEKRSGNKILSLKVEDTLTNRHHVAQGLKNEGFNFKFSGHYVLIEVDGIEDSELSHRTVVNSLNMTSGIIVNKKPEGKHNKIIYKDMIKGDVISYLIDTEDI